MSKGFGSDMVRDAWISRWDNVGFDGPVYTNWREYEIPDSLVASTGSWDISGKVMSVGYDVADATKGPSTTHHFHDVDITNLVSAQLAVAAWYNVGNGDPLDKFVLRFRLNGGPWHDRPLSADEITLLSDGHSQGAIGQVMDVTLGEIVPGENTLEFVTTGVPQNYPPAVSSIDLILTTK